MMFCHRCNQPSRNAPYCSEKCTKSDRAFVDQLTYRPGDRLVPVGVFSGDIAEKYRAQERLAKWDAREAQ